MRRGLIHFGLLLVLRPIRIGVALLHEFHRGLIVAALLLDKVQPVLCFGADGTEGSASLFLYVLLIYGLKDLCVVFEVFW